MNAHPGASPRSALVTGATGFIGSRLTLELVRRGWDVSVLARPTSDRSVLEDAAAKVRWITGDVLNPESLARAAPGCGVVFHCAGLTKTLDRRELWRINADGTRNVLEACAALQTPPRRIIALSSQAAAGPALPGGAPRRETDPPAPVSDYGRSKRAGEEWCERFAHRLPIVTLRPVAVYGPRDRDFFLIFRALRQTGLLVEAGAAAVHFQVIHADDVVGGCLAAAEAPTENVEGRTFFLGHPRTWPSDEFARCVGRAVGRTRIRILRLPMAAGWAGAALADLVSHLRRKPAIFSRDKMREIAASPWICDTEALASATGFRAQIDAPEGVALTAQWYREKGWLKP